VSTSHPIAIPLPTPSFMITQSPSGESLCRLVSQPSYQAPFSVKVFGRRIGGRGLIKFEAEAKNSSENATILPPRAEDTRSTCQVTSPGGKSTDIRRGEYLIEVFYWNLFNLRNRGGHYLCSVQVSELKYLLCTLDLISNFWGNSTEFLRMPEKWAMPGFSRVGWTAEKQSCDAILPLCDATDCMWTIIRFSAEICYK
jgi:hypothetical protein